MTIDEAIEILSHSANWGVTTLIQDFKDAELLGIEALKVLRHGRKIGSHYDPALLPGETEK